MALPSSGQIAISGINVELSYPATQIISLNDTAVRGLAQVPTGIIKLSNFYGKSSAAQLSLNIAGANPVSFTPTPGGPEGTSTWAPFRRDIVVFQFATETAAIPTTAVPTAVLRALGGATPSFCYSFSGTGKPSAPGNTASGGNPKMIVTQTASFFTFTGASIASAFSPGTYQGVGISSPTTFYGLGMQHGVPSSTIPGTALRFSYTTNTTLPALPAPATVPAAAGALSGASKSIIPNESGIWYTTARSAPLQITFATNTFSFQATNGSLAGAATWNARGSFIFPTATYFTQVIGTPGTLAFMQKLTNSTFTYSAIGAPVVTTMSNLTSIDGNFESADKGWSYSSLSPVPVNGLTQRRFTFTKASETYTISSTTYASQPQYSVAYMPSTIGAS